MFIVDKENYEVEVEQNTLPVIVDLWGPQCAPCLALMPAVEELASQFEGKIKFCKLNVAENRRQAITLKVMSVPTILFYKKGEMIDRISGDEVTLDAIRTRAEQLLG